jgi:hypothetical protein
VIALGSIQAGKAGVEIAAVEAGMDTGSRIRLIGWRFST